ncbi:hypothetical protein [Paenibacillus aquistagni]|uniref:hypothetical protein n=1 Tax=Paenibacillus aquistagni TaxID=1852522 RepID=UPI00145B06E8|nr:hypothetical protein [Paenibacillus aquistagni]NMM52655.1 hypothetical protein [Paenibacillus aquistagni]
MTKSRQYLLISGLIAVLLLVVARMPLTSHPSNHTRMVVDHTLQTYVAPPCFDDAELTNYLSETTWSKVKELHYKPESRCTEERIQPIKQTLWNKLLQSIGLSSSPWSW